MVYEKKLFSVLRVKVMSTAVFTLFISPSIETKLKEQFAKLTYVTIAL